jgi:hypothetical protein
VEALQSRLKRSLAVYRGAVQTTETLHACLRVVLFRNLPAPVYLHTLHHVHLFCTLTQAQKAPLRICVKAIEGRLLFILR